MKWIKTTLITLALLCANTVASLPQESSVNESEESVSASAESVIIVAPNGRPKDGEMGIYIYNGNTLTIVPKEKIEELVWLTQMPQI